MNPDVNTKNRINPALNHSPKILVIDDDSSAVEMLVKLINRLGFQVQHAPTIHQGFELAQAGLYQVVLLDVRLPDGIGSENIARFANGPGSPVVIIMTAYGDPSGAELAIRNGAWDYLTKPISNEILSLNLKRALDYQHARAALNAQLKLKRDEIVGGSRVLMNTLEQVAQASACEANVLIYGETGTGKELIARAIHDNSVRGLRRFVVVDCAALPETLVENLLFGHKKGAFTGAHQNNDGLIKQADGGTLFLDEIGELPLMVQKSFLRVLQERKYRPVGAGDYIQSDFRLIVATNKNLDHMLERRAFRDDLLFRLRSLAIELPPLRDRLEDLEPLSSHYMKKFFSLTSLPAKHFSAEFLKALYFYDWPGNVRELFSVLESSISSAKMEPVLLPIHLPISIRAQIIHRQELEKTEKGISENTTEMTAWSLAGDADRLPSFRDFRYAMEKQYLDRLVVQTAGNRTEACKISGLSRTRLFELLKKYEIG